MSSVVAYLSPWAWRDWWRGDEVLEVAGSPASARRPSAIEQGASDAAAASTNTAEPAAAQSPRKGPLQDAASEWNAAEWSPFRDGPSRAAGKKPTRSFGRQPVTSAGSGVTTHVLHIERQALDESFGLVLSEHTRAVLVDENGCAHAAGLQPLDRIVSVDGEQVSADSIGAQVAGKLLLEVAVSYTHLTLPTICSV